jgi:hypothetical protein
MTFYILHSLVVVIILTVRFNLSYLVLYINILALQQVVDDLSNLEIPRAKPARVAVSCLRF